MAFVVGFTLRLGTLYFIWLGCGRTHLFSACCIIADDRQLSQRCRFVFRRL
jgi:hypothetical protein